MILVFKLVATPLLIWALTLATRRYGPGVGGLLMGIPLTSGPISLILAWQFGPGFAAQAAVGSLVGQVSTGLFCLAYALCARNRGPAVCALVGLIVYVVATILWSGMTWTLWPATMLLATSLWLLLRLFPEAGASGVSRRPPRWELPARMATATVFVLALTGVARWLGPELSGLIAPLPIFALILAVFTHLGQGPAAAMALLAGLLRGSAAFGAFFVTVALALPLVPVPLAYGAAALLCVATSAGMGFWRHGRARRAARAAASVAPLLAPVREIP